MPVCVLMRWSFEQCAFHRAAVLMVAAPDLIAYAAPLYHEFGYVIAAFGVGPLADPDGT